MQKNIVIMLCALLVGCGSFVKTTQEGEKVRLLNKNQVSTCQYLGKTTVSVLDKIAFIERQTSSVEGNLQSLARNSAAEMSGDSIVVASTVHRGKQTFDVYQCMNPQKNASQR